MGNPYEVLGVKQDASMDEIKAAYKELVKKYHPDRYQNNPLADLAQEKLQEINEAYDYLSKNHKGGNQGGYNYGKGSTGGGFGGGSSELQAVRNMINSGNIQGAEAMLNKISNRNAEWNYLSGMISYRKGWYDDAMNKMQMAVNMEPNNLEYRQGLNTIANTGGGYRNASFGRGYSSNDDLACKLCQLYICFDCCCDCI